MPPSVSPPTSPALSPLVWLYCFFGFALAVVCSTLVIAERPGPLYFIAYLLVALPALFGVARYLLPSLTPRHDRVATLLVIGVLGGLTAAFLLIHPQIDLTGFEVMGVRVGAGDMDDAIDDGLRDLLQGRYPYYVRTFYDSPLTPLPGALVLALPFYWLGNSALQNWFWLGMFAVVAARHCGSVSAAAVLLVSTLVFSPILLLHLFQGSDYIANCLYLLVFGLMLVESMGEGRRIPWASVGWAVLLGIGLASRLNYVLLAPLVFAYLVPRVGWGAATKLASVISVTTALLTLPFYLYDPAGFSPLHAVRYAGGTPMLPIAAAGGLAVLLAFVAVDSPTRLLQAIFWVQLVLIALSMVAISLDIGRWLFDYARYGLLAHFFGVLGFGAAFCRPARARHSN